MDDLLKVAIAVIMMMGFPLLFYAGFVGVRVFQRRLEGKTVTPDTIRELEDLRSRIAELEQLHARVNEVEERMDFSERLLVQGRDDAGGLDQGASR